MNFHMGQKVVCISDDIVVPHYANVTPPKKGVVYCISGFSPTSGFLRLEEYPPLPNTPLPGVIAILTFEPEAFRPVKTTDISIFTAMLNPTPTKEKEVV